MLEWATDEHGSSQIDNRPSRTFSQSVLIGVHRWLIFFRRSGQGIRDGNGKHVIR